MSEEPEESFEDIIQRLLASAYRQGMAWQRAQDAQAAWQSESEIIVDNMTKINDLMNLGQERKEPN